jgi:hypothetical protein
MSEGVIRIASTGVYKTGDVDFDVTWDVTGQDLVTHIDWGQFDNWKPETWVQQVETNFVRTAELKLRSVNVSRTTCIYQADVPDDCEVEATVELVSGDNEPEGQLIFRYTDEDNYYFAGVNTYSKFAGIGKRVDGVYSMVITSDKPTTDTGKYVTKVRAIGNKLFLYIDDKLECWTTDDSHSTGRAGLTSNRSIVDFDYFYVRDINGALLEQDQFGDYIKDASFYIINREESSITLSAESADFMPIELVDETSLIWDLTESIPVNQSKRVNLTMEIFPDAPLGDFTYNILVRGNYG